jgi:ABC-type branched-subunit amino acid transport system permease subunit
VTRFLVFGISAFMTGIAGALLASGAGTISSVGFNSFQSLTWLAVLVLAGRGQFVSAVFAGIVLEVVPSYITDPTTQSYLPLVFGLSAIAIAAVRGTTSASRHGPAGTAFARSSHSPVKDRTRLAAPRRLPAEAVGAPSR